MQLLQSVGNNEHVPLSQIIGVEPAEIITSLSEGHQLKVKSNAHGVANSPGQLFYHQGGQDLGDYMVSQGFEEDNGENILRWTKGQHVVFFCRAHKLPREMEDRRRPIVSLGKRKRVMVQSMLPDDDALFNLEGESAQIPVFIAYDHIDGKTTHVAILKPEGLSGGRVSSYAEIEYIGCLQGSTFIPGTVTSKTLNKPGRDVPLATRKQ